MTVLYPNAVMGSPRRKVTGPIDPRLRRGVPGSISGILAWWDADQIKQVDNSDVIIWADASSHGNNLGNIQYTRPKFHTSVDTHGAFVAFGAGGNPCSLTTDNILVPFTDFSLFFVMKPGAANGGRMMGLENSGSGAAGLALHQAAQDFWVIRNANSTFDITGLGTDSTKPWLYELHMGSSGTSGTQALVNGVAKGSNSNTAWTSFAGEFFHMGSSGNNALAFQGNVYEFIVVGHKMTTTEATAMRNALNAKRNVY